MSAMAPDFDGESYDPALDHERLTTQLAAVRTAMLDGQWRTLEEIAVATGLQENTASISARLRDLRKSKFGGFSVDRRRRGDPKEGLWEYRVAEASEDEPFFDEPVVAPSGGLQARIADLEQENERLKERVAELEALLESRS